MILSLPQKEGKNRVTAAYAPAITMLPIGAAAVLIG